MSKAGVFIGISWTEYAKMADMHQAPVGAYTAQSAVLSVAAGNPAARLHTPYVDYHGHLFLVTACTPRSSSHN